MSNNSLSTGGYEYLLVARTPWFPSFWNIGSWVRFCTRYGRPGLQTVLGKPWQRCAKMSHRFSTCPALPSLVAVGHFLLETGPIIASAWQDVCDHAGLAVGSRVRAHFYCHGQKSRSWREADRTWQSYQWGTVKSLQVWRGIITFFSVVHRSDRSEIVSYLEAQVLAVGVEKRQGWEQKWLWIYNCTDHQVQILLQYLHVFTVRTSRQVTSNYAFTMRKNHAMFWQICRSNGSSDLRRASRVRLRILREA